MTRILSRLFRKVAKVGIVALAAAYLTAPVVSAQQPQPPALILKQTNRLAANGDAQFRIEMSFSKDLYAAIKKTTPDPVHLLRKFGLKSEESVTEGVKAAWNDAGNGVRYEYAVRGHARIGKDGLWGTQMPDGMAVTIRKFENGVAELAGESETPGLGRVVALATVTLPAGAADLKFSRDKSRLTYKLPEPAAGGSNVKHTFDVDAKPHVMGALAKVIGNRKFADLWVTRSVFRNTGDAVLKDYRVRFRVTDYTSAWSPWVGTPAVLPGQTVVDAYHPILDQDKVGRLTGQTKAAVEIEWQYTRPDGKVVTDSDTKEFTLLGRNQIQYTSLTSADVRDFDDAKNLSPFAMACLVTNEDSVIQQAVGRICKATGGQNAAGSDDDAIKFMTAVYDFMAANIAYQTPPGYFADGKLVQHVKYGRDVLKNKAGTCIDLAILYASLCEAVGLETVVYNVPRHAFPAVRLPVSGKLIPVEATAIGRVGFMDAVKDAAEKHIKPIGEGKEPAVPAMIAELHAAGVHPLDLPAVAEDALDKWGITFDGLGKSDGERVVPEDRPMPKPKPVQNVPVPVGVWRTTYQAGPYKATQTTTIETNGEIVGRAVFDNGVVLTQRGTYTVKGKVMTIRVTTGGGHTGSIIWNGKDEFTFEDDNGPSLVYKRVR